MNLRDMAFRPIDPPRSAVVPRSLRRPTAFLRPLPDYLIIGAQKSGTTSLQEYLDNREDIRPPLVKEVHFFDHHFTCGTGWYRTHFPIGRRSRTWRTGDASPYYLLHPHAPARAAAVVPDVRVVALLRNPINRAYSHFQHSRALGAEPLADFATAIAQEAERTDAAWTELSRTGRRQPAVEWYSYLRRGRYASQLERWRAEFPAEQILVITAEELFADPDVHVRRICRHIGVAADMTIEFERRHARQYFPMSPAIHQQLAEYFSDDVARVEALLGRPTNWLNPADVSRL